MADMRAKMQVTGVKENFYQDKKTGEALSFRAVGKDGSYPSDGTSDDNTYALWTPAGELSLTVNNPVLWGKFTVGQKFYIDFNEVIPQAVVA